MTYLLRPTYFIVKKKRKKESHELNYLDSLLLLYILQNTQLKEWLSFYSNSAICQLSHGENKLIVNENDEENRSVLDRQA